MATIGRPRLDQPRGRPLPIRFTEAERAAVTAAAERAGLTVSEWCRGKLLDAAKRQR